MREVSKTERGAIVRGGTGPLWREQPRRPLLAGEARIRVLLTGICRTDLFAADGVLPTSEGRVLGHEFVGEIEEIEGHAPFSTGVRVTANPLIHCRRCNTCERQNFCDTPQMLGIDRDGSFSTHVNLPWVSLYEVPQSLSLHRAAYTEPVAASLAIFKAPISPSLRGLLLGTNRIASLTLRLLQAREFRQITQLSTEEEVPKGSFDFAIETVATESSLRALMNAVRPGGCVVLKSRPPQAVPLDLALAVRRDLHLCAVGYGSFSEAIRLLQELPVEDFFGETFPLHRFTDAFAKAREGESSKIFLDPT